MDEACEVHELMWCAICNGDVKKFEEDERTEFSGLQSLARGTNGSDES